MLGFYLWINNMSIQILLIFDRSICKNRIQKKFLRNSYKRDKYEHVMNVTLLAFVYYMICSFISIIKLPTFIILLLSNYFFAKSAGAVEYSDCFSAEG